MAAITLGQVLEHVDQFERMQWDFYEKLSKETIHEGVRLLTEYMSRHSVHIRELLETLPPGRKHSFCSPPLPYKPIFPESIASIWSIFPPIQRPMRSWMPPSGLMSDWYEFTIRSKNSRFRRQSKIFSGV